MIDKSELILQTQNQINEKEKCFIEIYTLHQHFAKKKNR